MINNNHYINSVNQSKEIVMKNAEIKTRIIALKAADKSNGYIREVVKDEFGLTNSRMIELYDECASEQGWAKSSQGNQDLEALVRVMIEYKGKIKRDALITKMSEASGYSLKTANHMLSQLKFAEEFARQTNKSTK